MVDMISDLMTRARQNAENIDTFSYTDFLSLVHQTNVPPGSYVTIQEWGVFGGITKESRILELASTTGFSLRELSGRFEASGLGIDISTTSVERANKLAKNERNNKIEYRTLDAHSANHLLRNDDFTHIVIGASLRFIDNLRKTPFLENLLSEIDRKIVILTCEFYANEEVPKELLRRGEEVFGMKPTNSGYKEVMKPYAGLRKLYEVNRDIRKETEDELRHYCESTMERFCDEYGLSRNDEIATSCFDRLYGIKEMSNDLREYQRYVCLVHEYDPSEFGRRYTEIF